MIRGIWLGPNPLPELAQRCIATWGDEYEIYGAARLSSVVPALRDMPYFRDAYAANHWAGASDVARLALLYELGGVYLDCDVEVIDLPRLLELQDGKCHLGLEDEKNVCGAVIVAPPKHEFVGHMLDVYRNTKFSDTFNGRCNGTTLLTAATWERKIADVALHAPHDFYPWHWGSSSRDKLWTVGAITAHHWAHQWKQVNA